MYREVVGEGGVLLSAKQDKMLTFAVFLSCLSKNAVQNEDTKHCK